MHWTESIVVDRPVPQVQAAIADEHQLMAWSAWPAATGFVCAVEGYGRSVGSSIVFRDSRGTEQGRQRLTAVEDGRVEYRLRNNGPGGRIMTPELDFRLARWTAPAPVSIWTSAPPCPCRQACDTSPSSCWPDGFVASTSRTSSC